MTTWLLWLEAQATGTDPVEDDILEVAAVLTGTDLVTVGEYSAVIRPRPTAVARAVENLPLFYQHMTSGLAADLANPAVLKDLAVVHIELGDMLGEHISSGDVVYLAGSKVMSLRRILVDRFPSLQHFLTGEVCDVQSLRQLWSWSGQEAPLVATAVNHRAPHDLGIYVDEARAVKTLFAP